MVTIERNTHYNCMACKDRMSDYKIIFGGQGTCQNYIAVCTDCLEKLKDALKGGSYEK